MRKLFKRNHGKHHEAILERQFEDAREIIYSASRDTLLDGSELESAIRLLNESDEEVYTLLTLASSQEANFLDKDLAIEILYTKKSQERIHALKKNLADHSPDIRVSAAEILLELGEPEWDGIILGDNPDYVRLAETEDPIFIEPLAKTACFWDVPWAKKALETKIGNSHVIESLYTYLGSDNKTRRNAAKILAKIGEPHWVEVIKGDDDDILRIMESDEPKSIWLLPSLLWSAKGSGDIIRKIERLDRIKDPLIIDTLINFLYHQDTSIRIAAARTLIKISKEDFSLVSSRWEEALELITTPHEHKNEHGDSPRGLSDCHGDTMKHTDTGIGLEIPIELQVSPTKEISMGKKAALVNPVKRLKLKRLIEIINNRQELTGKTVYVDEKYKAILKIEQLRNAQVVGPLIDTLQGRVELVTRYDSEIGYKMCDYEVRGLAAYVLGNLGDSRAVGPLARALLEDKQDEVRGMSAVALGKLLGTQAIEALTCALSDGYGHVRLKASESLWEMGETQWRSVIQGNESDFERLAGMEDRMAISSLLRALKTETGKPRELLIKALVGIISNPAGIVRKQFLDSVVFAFENIPLNDRKQVVNELIHALKNPSGFVREQAAKSLIHFVKQDFSLVQDQWETIVDQVTTPHEDRVEVIEVRTYNDHHFEYYNKKQRVHTDTGIGLEIPPELKT